MALAPDRTVRALWLLAICNYFAVLAVTSRFVPTGVLGSVGPALWLGAVWLSYGALVLLPSFALAGLGAAAARRGLARFPRPASALASLAAALPFASILLLLLSDERIHALYGFHLNGFVWNLVTTRGGIAALGAGPETVLAAAALGAAVLAGEFALAYLLLAGGRGAALRAAFAARRPVAVSLLALLALSGVERLAFATSRVTGYVPILELEEVFPFYQTTSFDHLATQLGFRVARATSAHVELSQQLRYPLHPLAFRDGAPRYNVLVLCAESLRADALTPERMPATWAFSERAWRFEQHLSSGNGTRMGVFGLFYGLPGPYWFRFLDRRSGPVLVRSLVERGYDVRGFTADDFSYPEFDQTVFADVDRARLVEEGPQGHRPSWQRDREMTGALLDFLARRDPAQPFFAYAFFESPHARYEFPPETAVNRPYLERFDYLTMDVERDIGKIRNRYWNSVLHLDTQVARILAALEQQGLLDDTLVVITGDHGEEFMESGRWGHNSAFSEAQIRVPLVLSVPGRGARRVDAMTSHLDVAATLLGVLGVSNAPDDYSMGRSLLDGAPRRWTLVSDWNHVTYLDDEGKVSLPMRAASWFRWDVASRRDQPLRDPNAYLGARVELFPRVMTELGHLAAAHGR